ncbi:SseB family protein [Pseudoruegeria sp. SHC-113]|uniref:SseB family protein n=1 Tax=Pseudoruegeria sp. SHC-113 TaxID=2855439 RepID=UPI0021BB8C61|nr:SseB family protein [Pseudoruegeria sp. SHC-113]MCT8161102.1 SseB family protein [Pseudoruegeria sp. SHC-113]
MTPLDTAHAAMQAAPEDDAARLRFYERLADGELYLLLEAEAEGEQITPRLFETDQGAFVVVFDREERLAEFAGGVAPFAALSGRLICGMLAGQGYGLGVNLGVAPSEILIPASAVDWLQATLAQAPQELQARPEEVRAPGALPEALLTGLDAKLATATGLARFAYLAAVTYEGGGQGHLLAFVDPVPGAEDPLARAVAEALTFSGIEAGGLDVAFFRASDPICAKLARVGLRFDLPELPKESVKTPGAAPGMDPDKPPRLT